MTFTDSVIISPEVVQLTSAQISLAKKIDMDILIIRVQGNATPLFLDGERASVFVNNPCDSYEEKIHYGSISGKENGVCKSQRQERAKTVLGSDRSLELLEDGVQEENCER